MSVRLMVGRIFIAMIEMSDYIFSVHYYGGESRLIKIKARTRAKAYELARVKAIRIKNDLDLIELETVI